MSSELGGTVGGCYCGFVMVGGVRVYVFVVSFLLFSFF